MLANLKFPMKQLFTTVLPRQSMNVYIMELEAAQAYNQAMVGPLAICAEPRPHQEKYVRIATNLI